MIPGYLTIAAVADRLKVKPATVRRYLHRKDMPPPDERVGQSPLWKEETIDRWIEARPSTSWKS